MKNASTLTFETTAATPTPAIRKLSGTVAGLGPVELRPTPARERANATTLRDPHITIEEVLDDTLARVAKPLALKTTVLPRLELDEDRTSPVLRLDERPRYKELCLLGEGGLGEVMLAEDEDIGRHVAIKRLHDETDRGTVMRFVDEVRVMGHLDHPNIVPVHDVGTDPEGHLYFVMKKVDGDTLETLIERLRDGDAATARRFPLAVRVEIFLGILRAVQFAHARRIVHRDLKPANVMVGDFGEVVVMDWGIAKRLDDPLSSVLDEVAPIADEAPTGARAHRPFQTRVGTLLGTPAYMSPEQARGDTDLLDERSDIYALGVLLYEWVTLRHYLDGVDDLYQLLDAIRTRQPAPAAFVRVAGKASGVSMELSAVIARAMSKERDDRYQTIGELIEAIHAVTAGTFPVSCPITLTKRMLSALGASVDRHPKVTMIAVLAALLGVIGSAVGLIVWMLVA